jgi:hypothetical protein
MLSSENCPILAAGGEREDAAPPPCLFLLTQGGQQLQISLILLQFGQFLQLNNLINNLLSGRALSQE